MAQLPGVPHVGATLNSALFIYLPLRSNRRRNGRKVWDYSPVRTVFIVIMWL